MARRNREPKITKTPFVLSRSFLSGIIAILLRLLIYVSIIGFVGGIIKTFLDLEILLHEGVEESLRQLILNVITLLAVVEVIRTVLSYLSEGRVKVTFIVDTVLIVLLNEIISLWFRGPNISEAAVLIMLIATLIIVRLLTIRFSPDTE
jgi:uncharacterized membrane protein (DUF373 family)